MSDREENMRFDLMYYIMDMFNNSREVHKDDFRETTDDIILGYYGKDYLGNEDDYVEAWSRILDEVAGFVGLKVVFEGHFELGEWYTVILK